jgi:hypothetical protein
MFEIISIICEDDKYIKVSDIFDEIYYYDNYHVIINKEDRYIKGFIKGEQVFNMILPSRKENNFNPELSDEFIKDFRSNIYLLKGEVVQKKINNILS